MNDKAREYWLRTMHSSMAAFFSNPDEAAQAALQLAILKYREAAKQPDGAPQSHAPTLNARP